MKPVTVAAFNLREEAEPLQAYLAAAGIQSELQAELGEEGVEYGRPMAGVRLVVAREDFEEALQLVYDWNSGGGTAEAEVEAAEVWLRRRTEGVLLKRSPPAQ